MTQAERQQLRDAAQLAMDATPPRSSVERVLDRWRLQTSNSFRRIGLHGDGDVLCGTKHPIDGHPDLLAKPAVLDYIVAAQPAVVLALLDDINALEDKLRQAQVVGEKIADVESRLTDVRDVIVNLGAAVEALAIAADEASLAHARAVVEKLSASLREVRK